MLQDITSSMLQDIIIIIVPARAGGEPWDRKVVASRDTYARIEAL